MCDCTLHFNTCKDFGPDFNFCGSKHQHCVVHCQKKKIIFQKKIVWILKILVGFEVITLCEVPLRVQERHENPILLHFRFWQWYCWRFKFPVLRHCVVGWVVPDISKDCRHIPEALNLQFLFPLWYSFETHNFLWGIYDLWWWEFQWICCCSLFCAVELLVVV
jgi:hypothetical protein